jgi:hypothetical protein
MNLNLADELQKICRLWPFKIGLITCLIAEIIFIGIIFSQIDGLDKTTTFNIPSFIFVCLIVCFVTFLYWLYSNKIPRNKKGKFGFVVSLYCDNDETDKKFREDFVNNLRKQISDGPTGQYFNFIEIKNYAAKAITRRKEAELILEKTKAHFVIYGRVKTRNTTHYVELHSIITHKPLPVFVSNELSKEMSELLPRKIQIEDNKFLESFEFTSKWAEVASKYLIGNVKLLSEDIGPAFELYNEVLHISKNNKDIPEIEQLCSKSTNNIVSILDIKINSLYKEWVETHDILLFKKIHLMIVEYDKYGITSYSIETIKAIVSVLLFQDIELATKILSRFPNNVQNATWLLNRAFLLAYKGNLTASYREYKRALTRPIEEFDDGLINKVEDFIELMISQNKNVHQLHYCLGIINKEFKGDFLLAKQDLEKFLSATPINTFIKEKEIASKWINEITKKAA